MPSPARSATLLITAALLTVALLAGCATHGGVERQLVAQQLRDRGLSPADVVLPYALTPEIRAWAHAQAPADLPEDQRLSRLLAALLDGDELGGGALDLEYAWGYTGTAAEVFTERRANCLAFTNLFLGMAREVGVPVYFLAVESETYRKREDIVVVSDHIAVGYGPGQKIQMFDFSDTRSARPPRVRKVSDLTAVAMFHSNRGAEVLQQGQITEALRWLRTAIAIDPELASARVNLGVALRRAGDLEAAERAYRQALEIAPETYAAYQNLASLLYLQGRKDEARQFELALKRSPSKNPYTYLSLGDISLQSGRFDEARSYYRRAAHLDGDTAESYAALGQLAVATGDLTEARRMLRKARKLDEENARTQLLATMIARN